MYQLCCCSHSNPERGSGRLGSSPQHPFPPTVVVTPAITSVSGDDPICGKRKHPEDDGVRS